MGGMESMTIQNRVALWIVQYLVETQRYPAKEVGRIMHLVKQCILFLIKLQKWDL